MTKMVDGFVKNNQTTNANTRAFAMAA